MPVNKDDKKEQFYKIVIDEQGDIGGLDDVYISVNGNNYIIKRGFDVVVPESVINVLKESVYIKYKKNNKGEDIPFEVPRFSFRVKSTASQTDKAINKKKINMDE